MKCTARIILAAVLYLVGASAFAQNIKPLDRSYLGELTLSVDLSDTTQRILHVTEFIPVQPGKVSLHYPKWIPGEHSPSGTLSRITGLIINGADSGPRITWRRDLEDMYTLHLDVPAGVTKLQLEFQALTVGEGGDFGASTSATSKIMDLEWNQVVFYPAGYWSRGIHVHPVVKLPPMWKFATALEVVTQTADTIEFKSVSLEELVDSPLIAGINFKRVELGSGARPVYLNIVADHPGDLVIKDEQLKAHQNLVTQASALFGAHHYDHYDFLYTLSENMGTFGLEHHQSSDDRWYSAYFIDPDTYLAGVGLLPHEYVHSWNGKFRRPADLWTPTFNVAMHDDLLWAYEGLTEYFGNVLTARSGLFTPEQYRDALAVTAASMNNRPGRSWRSLQDTADEAQDLYYSTRDWSSWRRSVDFYDEGELLWLEVDTLIRELSQGKRSLDDFAKAFYGMNDGSRVVKTYTFDDIIKALNQVQPYDWAKLLRTRLTSTDVSAPLDGIKRGGWSLVYTDTPSDYFKALEKTGKSTNLLYSLGISIDADENRGKLLDVLWNSPAFIAGLAPGMKIVAVNGEKFDADQLKEWVKTSAGNSQPIELLVESQNVYMTLKINYHEGLKHPHLQRVEAEQDRLSEIVRAK